MTIIPTTLGITTSIFGGASLVGMMLPRGFMLGYGTVLFGGMLGLIGLNVAAMIAAKSYGMVMLAQTLMTAESIIGVGLFSALLVYDTHKAIQRYEKKDADHLGMSIQILLDLWNLIIRIASRIAKTQA
jgi:FtsH-binding integral membrane protein